jgi:hypothetical protein
MKLVQPRYIPALVTVALLLGLKAESLSHPQPEDVEPYHAELRKFKTQFNNPDGWTAKVPDDELPAGAVALLKPNLTICRAYLKPRFQFLLVQCLDARDMGGHYPPNCYPASGCVLVGPKDGKDMTWVVEGKTIEGKEYVFSHLEAGQTRTQIVDNLLILPAATKHYVKKMDDVRAVAANNMQRFYGAAQIQFVFDGEVSESDRRDIFTKLIGKNMNLLNVLERSNEPRSSN